ncbi:hypothetical protein BDR03DRAFT_953833 [Suillus americanus]|nr:hypothetical protein BDR03DRAFT_953833 [Suillus americanus]
MIGIASTTPHSWKNDCTQSHAIVMKSRHLSSAALKGRSLPENFMRQKVTRRYNPSFE